jgi:broad specificity phosphatase PhoE
MLRVLVIRHGRTAWNAAGRLQGQRDTSLSAEGRAQAAAVAGRLAAEPIDQGFCSDLSRARETAAPLASARGLTFRPTPPLRELDFGQWEGMTFQQIQAAGPTEAAAWVRDPFHCSPPGGETAAMLAERIAGFWQNVLSLDQPHVERTIVVVTHSGPGRMLISLALGLSGEHHGRFQLRPGSISQLEVHDGYGILVGVNDVPMADEAPAPDPASGTVGA